MFRNWIWNLAGGRVLGPAPFFVMGILNITPNSFYDGGENFAFANAFKCAEDMIRQGADIVDIGGESTRPYSQRINAEVELSRLKPVTDELIAKFPNQILSVDTYKAKVALNMLKKGVKIVNDISACRFDPSLREILVQFKPGYVLMHSLGRPEEMQKKPSYADVVKEIKVFFEYNLNLLVKSGIPEENIVLDPGIGFGKTLEHNLLILKKIKEFNLFARPVMLGLSNKSMWQKLLGLPPKQRKYATQVATALTSQKGVCLHRVHEVELTRQTLRIVSEIG